MAKKIIHFSNRCIGCLACVGLAPQIFEFDGETGKATLIEGIKSEIDGEAVTFKVVKDEELTDEIMTLLTGSCCTQAIKIEEVNEGEEGDNDEDEDINEDGGEGNEEGEEV